NRVTQAMRQPGSIFKPFVYAAAFETALQGAQFDLDPQDDRPPAVITPISMVNDEPTVFYDGAGKDYTPKNFNGQYCGEVPLRTAFQCALNVPTVRLGHRIGFDRIAQLARRMGMNAQIQGYPSVALGAFEVKPIEIAGAFTAFANNGQRVEPHA